MRRSHAEAAALLLAAASLAMGQSITHVPPCSNCATWNQEQKPFQIYGNTYYVGPHGLSSILITSARGHILIDGALPESVPQIVAHVRSLGFRIEDVKLILNSHAHFDHAGGIAGLQRLSGAEVAASPWSAEVMTKSGVSRDDPQFGIIEPIAKIGKVTTLHDGQVLRVGDISVTAHFTPGHTPGGTTWTWQSCQDGRCLNVVYSDSVTAVSADGFRFSDSKQYPNAAKDFEKSFAFLRSTPCDILLTAHPEVSDLWTRKETVAPNACKELADRASEQFRQRLATESGK